MKAIKFLALFLSFFSFTLAQNPEWINFTAGNYVQAVAVEENYILVGTEGGGLVRLDKTTGSMTFYKRSNSGLPSEVVRAIAIWWI